MALFSRGRNSTMGWDVLVILCMQGTPSSVLTTGSPGTAREGRLLEPSCPDPDAGRSSCSIHQAQQRCSGALSAQSWQQ